MNSTHLLNPRTQFECRKDGAPCCPPPSYDEQDGNALPSLLLHILITTMPATIFHNYTGKERPERDTSEHGCALPQDMMLEAKPCVSREEYNEPVTGELSVLRLIYQLSPIQQLPFELLVLIAIFLDDEALVSLRQVGQVMFGCLETTDQQNLSAQEAHYCAAFTITKTVATKDNVVRCITCYVKNSRAKFSLSQAIQ